MIEKKLQEKEADIENLKNNFLANKENEQLKEREMCKGKSHAIKQALKDKKNQLLQYLNREKAQNVCRS